ncbi:MAG: hypothetical protein LBF60_00805, partial [Treponema sp.]|nr:hypothetical protein [Treponema sp.]
MKRLLTNELTRQLDAIKRVTSSSDLINKALPATNEWTKQLDAITSVTSSFVHITEALSGANELTRQFDLAKAALSPMGDMIKHLEPMKKAIPSWLNASYLTEFQKS